MKINKSVAIIPARGGSKRIPGKNIKLFDGKPIIEYSIETALKSGLFKKVIVTTDSYTIATIANKAGAEILMEPESLALDHIPTWEIINYVLKNIEYYKYACCIYATAPFLKVEYLKEGFKNLKKSNGSFSVTNFDFPIQRALKIKNNNIEMFNPEYELTRSQDLEKAYHDVGQFYWLNVKEFLEQKSMYLKPSIPVILPELYCQDIDTMEDWEIAEMKYKILKEKNERKD